MLPSIILGFCFLVGAPGNALVIGVILSQTKRLTFTLRLIANLAVTDLLALLVLPFWIYALVDSWIYGWLGCKILSFVVYCSMYASIFSVLMLSLHRCVLVLAPLWRWKSKGVKLGNRQSVCLLAGLWCASALLTVPVLEPRSVMLRDGRFSCIASAYTSIAHKVALLLLETLLGFVLPFLVIAISYCLISKRITERGFLWRRRLTRLTAWIVFTFFIFWFPYHLVNLVKVGAMLRLGDSEDLHIPSVWVNAAGALTFINSCLNPFIYAFTTIRPRKDTHDQSTWKQLCQSCWSQLREDLPSQIGSEESRKAAVRRVDSSNS
ncbi:leukotriene B4 receptor 1-like [Erpetoichthys calabaricus]|uniref:leukotriene B4 receptor 1-like n=1 Tax=Erpetoichthys calabaricus TaxID=27687 RepID=UPI002234D33C|nr:leukotriene B4 receptor 1-like [Erpetoichthys calabaricus]